MIYRGPKMPRFHKHWLNKQIRTVRCGISGVRSPHIMSELQHSTLRAEKDALPFSRPTTPGARPPQIGFVGLGSMGYPMARNLATHKISLAADLPPLLVWNRTFAKAEQLLKEVGQDNIRIAKDLAQVAADCDVIITNLANDTVVKAVYEEYSKALTVRDVPTIMSGRESRIVVISTHPL